MTLKEDVLAILSDGHPRTTRMMALMLYGDLPQERMLMRMGLISTQCRRLSKEGKVRIRCKVPEGIQYINIWEAVA